MSKDKRTGWLAGLQVGDKVFVVNWYTKRLGEVTKITPTGRIVIGNITFTPNGRQYGSGSFGSYVLKECTKKKYEEFMLIVHKQRKVEIIAETTKDTLMKLPLEMLEKFVEAIEECMEE